jgi:hypothetical protein
LPLPQWFHQYNDVGFLESIHKSLNAKLTVSESNRWMTVLNMLSYRASILTKTNVYDPHFNFSERSHSRVIWIGLNSVPDFRDDEAIKNYDQNRSSNLIDIFESCAAIDGGLYYAWI